MISLERASEAARKFFRLVGLPLLVILLLAILVEVIGPQFTLEGFVTPGGFLGFWANALLNALPALMAMVAVPWIASRYLDTLYSIGDLSEAHRYLQVSIFGQISSKPWIVIAGGEIAKGKDSTLARVGGPGLLIIYNNNVVITEQNGRLKQILEPGYGRVERFERIWEIVDLRPQHWVLTVSALTRDGIPITCDVDITFKIDDRVDGLPLEPTDDVPYPYTRGAVFKAATCTRIREEEREDQVMKWTGKVVIGNAEGGLRGILARYRLDQLVYPDPRQSSGSNEAREEIRQELQGKLESSSAGFGVRILNVDIGKVDVKVNLPAGEEESAEKLTDEVLKQWIKTWKAELERVAVRERAEGEAEIASLEIVSVQAQAEMILTLTEAMQQLISTEQATAYRLALRFVETLRWMAYNPNVRAFMPLEPLRSLEQLQETVEKSKKSFLESDGDKKDKDKEKS